MSKRWGVYDCNKPCRENKGGLGELWWGSEFAVLNRVLRASHTVKVVFEERVKRR